MTVRCGNRKAHGPATENHHHEDAAAVRACYATPDGLMSLEQQAEDDGFDGFDADAKYERFLENQYSDIIAWEEERERSRLMVF